MHYYNILRRYVNHTGLMWENAAAFGAAMVFAEHRYYGESTPFPDGTSDCLRWLTTDQALADYAQLIRSFKEALLPPPPVFFL